jgi:hypothetical protein
MILRFGRSFTNLSASSSTKDFLLHDESMGLSGRAGFYILWRPLRVRTVIHPPSFSTKACDPLRILFCGSDDFSIASLKALHGEHSRRSDVINSIDVVLRPGKRVGRGLKTIREGRYLESKQLHHTSAYMCPSTYQGCCN